MITNAYRLFQDQEPITLLCLVCDRYTADPDAVTRRQCRWCFLMLAHLPVDFQRKDEVLHKGRYTHKELVKFTEGNLAQRPPRPEDVGRERKESGR